MAIAMPKTVQPPVKGGPPEHLIYASTAEEKLLKALGGAGMATKFGVPSYENLYGHATPSETKSYYSAPSNNNGPTGGNGSNYSPSSGYSTSAPSSSPSSSNNNGGHSYSENSAAGNSSPVSRETSYGGSWSGSNGGGGSSDSASSRSSNGSNFSFSSPGSFNNRSSEVQTLNSIANTLGQRNNGGNGMVAFGSAPIGTDTINRQQGMQIKPVAFQPAQPSKDFVSVASVPDVPNFNGPHAQPMGFATQASPADLAASYAAYRSPPGQSPSQPQSTAPAVASSWLGASPTQSDAVQSIAWKDPRAGYYDQKGVTPQTQFADRLREDLQLQGVNPNDKANAAVMGSLNNEKLGAYMTPGSNPWDVESAAANGHFKPVGTNPDGKYTAGGAAQWNGSRLGQVNTFFSQNGLDQNDPNNQASAVAAEIAGKLPGQTGDYRDTYNSLGAKGQDAATQTWMRNYENPSFNPRVNNIAGRKAAANQFASNFPIGSQPTSMGASDISPTQVATNTPVTPMQVVAANDQTQPQSLYNADTITPPPGANAPTGIVDRVLGAPSPQLGPGQTTDVPLQVASHLPGIAGKLAMALGTPRTPPNAAQAQFAIASQGAGHGSAEQTPTADPAQAQGNQNAPTIAALNAELATSTDPVRKSQIIALLNQLDPSTLNYGLQMRQNT